MGLKKFISSLFSPRTQVERYYDLAVKCRRCGEVIQGRVDLHNELSIQYDEHGKASYFGRKVLISDSGRCFQSIEVELTFDANHALMRRQIHGGEFVEEA